MTNSDQGSPGSRVPAAAVVAVVVVLLLLAAISTPEAFVWLRHTGVAKVVLPDTPYIANYLLVAVSVAFVIAALVLRVLVVSRHRGEVRASNSPWWTRLLAFALFLILLRVAVSSDFLRRRLQELSRRFAPAKHASTPAAHPGGVVPHITSRPLGIALTILLALMLALGIAAIVFLLARVKGEVTPPEPDDDLAIALDASIDDLRDVSDPRQAVIACYGRMERFMASSGTPRLPADTPTEFLARVLEQRSVSPASASRLTVLFERAKFSPHRIDEQMREEALSALEQVRSELALV